MIKTTTFLVLAFLAMTQAAQLSVKSMTQTEHPHDLTDDDLTDNDDNGRVWNGTLWLC